MAITGRGRAWEWGQSVWVAAPLLSLGLLSPFAFAYAAHRARNPKWRVATAVYVLLYPALFLLPDETPLAGLLILFNWIVTSVHAFLARPEFLIRVDAGLRVEERHEAMFANDIIGVTVARPVFVQPGATHVTLPGGQVVPVPQAYAPPPVHPPAYAPQPAPPPAYAPPPAAPPVPLELNGAPEEAIAALPSIGAVLARRAVQERAARGGFRSVEEFGQALGLKPHVLERIRPYVHVAPPAAQARTPRPGGRRIDY